MSVILHCDFCGEEQDRDEVKTVTVPEPIRLWSTLLLLTDYRPCGTKSGVEKKECHICPKCTEAYLLKKLKK